MSTEKEKKNGLTISGQTFVTARELVWICPLLPLSVPPAPPTRSLQEARASAWDTHHQGLPPTLSSPRTVPNKPQGSALPSPNLLGP